MSNIPGCKQLCQNNVVDSKTLHDIQLETLDFLRKCLEKTYGPMGSYTSIMKGEDNSTAEMMFSKDGKKVLKHILLSNPIEACMKSEIEEITRYVEAKVGDGTTSAVILSALIYAGIYDFMRKEENKKYTPRMIMDAFRKVTTDTKKIISSNAKDVTLEDIYNICMISTNGDKYVSRTIRNIYEDYGLNVDINIDVSNDQSSKIKTYDGFSVDEGYAMPSYINTEKGTSEIHNPEIYAFKDAIDTPELTGYMKAIIDRNIINHAQDMNFVPTVIMAPIIGRDASGILENLDNYILQFNKKGYLTQKPPILVVTNLTGTMEGIYLDIAKICGCRYIGKYIDPEQQKKDQEAGIAPTISNLKEFAGTAELVKADASRTQFINPYDIVSGDSTIYNDIISWLKGEIYSKEENNDDPLKIERLKKRLGALESNMVEYYVGGIAVSDRNAAKDLVEDAVKNCRSAAKYGYGRAANFEAYIGVLKIDNSSYNKLEKDIQEIIIVAYEKAIKSLYESVIPEFADCIVELCVGWETPINVLDLVKALSHEEEELSEFKLREITENLPLKNNDVICSIRTDIEILDAISKIIGIMVTSNQCLLQSTHLNTYCY